MFISIDRLNFCSQKFKSRLAAELYIVFVFFHKRKLSSPWSSILVFNFTAGPILVLLVHFANDLSKEIWMQAGTSMNKKFIAAHTVDLDPVLRHYHLCTVDYWGSMSYLVSQSGDKVSQLRGIGKATAWKTSTKNDYLLDGLGHDTMIKHWQMMRDSSAGSTLTMRPTRISMTFVSKCSKRTQKNRRSCH